jgi:hypothetical protein
MEGAHENIAILKSTAPMFPLGTLLLILSGLYLATTQWSISTPWVVIALVSLVLIAAVGAVVGGRHGKSIERHATQLRGPIPDELARVIQRPSPEIISFGLGGAALGLLWIMEAKPGWTGSAMTVAIGAALGALIGATVFRGSGARRVNA